MLVKSVLSVGLAATAAQAFVVIPIADADRAISDLLPFDAPSKAAEQSIDIACPGCPVDIESAVFNDVPNHLEMTFSIDKSSNGDSLLANGFELYPNPDPFTNSLVAPQITEVSHMGEMAHAKVQQLGYRFHVYPIAREEEGQQLELIGIDLQIVEVGGAFVNGIPDVKIQLVKNGDNLAIANVEMIEPIPEPGADCTTLFCKWKAIVAHKLAMLKRPGAPCPGKFGHGPGPHGHPHGHPHGMPGGMPQGGPPHSPHHPAMPPNGVPEGQFHRPGPFHHGPPGHRHHGIAHVFVMILTHILLPILIGIVAGVTASLIGMVLVSIVMRVYNVIRGRQSSPEQPPSYKANPSEAIVSEEKAGLMEEQDDVEPPPSYSDETPDAKV